MSAKGFGSVWRGIFRPDQEADAADAGGIGKSADAAGAEETRQTDPKPFADTP